MNNSLNSFEGIVRILESPIQDLSKNDIVFTRIRAQLPQIRQTQVIILNFWGKLARDVADYYKVNDYIIVEGYISYNLDKIEITGLKIYPISLNSNKVSNKF